MAEQINREVETKPWTIELMNRIVENKFAGMIKFIRECNTSSEIKHRMIDLMLETRAFEKCLIEEIEKLRSSQN